MSSPQPLWVAKGNLEIGIGLTSGTALVSGVDLVGALPAEIQNFTLYSAGIVASSKQADAAKAFITVLSSPAAQTVLRAPSLERGEAAAPLQIRLLLRPHPPKRMTRAKPVFGICDRTFGSEAIGGFSSRFSSSVAAPVLQSWLHEMDPWCSVQSTKRSNLQWIFRL